jgi:hypothetical protein
MVSLFAASFVVVSRLLADSAAPNTALCRLDGLTESLVPGPTIVPERKVVGLEYIDDAALLIGEMKLCSIEGTSSCFSSAAWWSVVRTQSYNVCRRLVSRRVTPNSCMGPRRFISGSGGVSASDSARCLEGE